MLLGILRTRRRCPFCMQLKGTNMLLVRKLAHDPKIGSLARVALCLCRSVEVGRWGRSIDRANRPQQPNLPAAPRLAAHRRHGLPTSIDRSVAQSVGRERAMQTHQQRLAIADDDHASWRRDVRVVVVAACECKPRLLWPLVPAAGASVPTDGNRGVPSKGLGSWVVGSRRAAPRSGPV